MIDKENNILVSIVVPAYNVAPYIDELIESVVCQWDEQIELIIVNDGSTDELQTLLARYEMTLNTKNFVVLNKENGGASSARNEGIKCARGEYILFLDGDDVLAKHALQAVVHCLRENRPDCLLIDFCFYYEDKTTRKGRKHPIIQAEKLITDKEYVLKSVYFSKRFYLYLHIFKREILLSYPQPEGKIYEDISTTPIYLHKANSFYYLPIDLIYYRQRAESAVRTKNEKNVLDLTHALIPVTEYFQKTCSVISEELALAHFVVNWHILALCYKDVVTGTLDVDKYHHIFVDNFNKCHLMDMKKLRSKLFKLDKGLWLKVMLFGRRPSALYSLYKMKHTFKSYRKQLSKG